MPSNVLFLHLKETFPPIIGIFTEGDGIKSRLPFKIFSTLIDFEFISTWCRPLGYGINASERSSLLLDDDQTGFVAEKKCKKMSLKYVRIDTIQSK